MERRDYYEILGVDRSANETQIKRAYRALPCGIILTAITATPRPRNE